MLTSYRLLLALLPSLAAAAPGTDRAAIPPAHIEVLPVFFVPTDQPKPTDNESARLQRHLEWSRRRYRELLGGQDTFTIASGKPRVLRAERPLAYYRQQQPEAFGGQVAAELLREFQCTRYNCPYVFVTVVMNPRDDFPNGGGRPLNGGYNTGGGIILLSSFNLDRIPYFQSTLQHELGHSFGLPHVDVYGYSMKSGDSIMSYNPAHHTKGFTDSSMPGKFIPEDLRGLALNRRALPNFRYDAARDMPAGYQIAKRIVPLGTLPIPGQPVVLVTTDSGETFNSKVGNAVQNMILPSKKTDSITYDGKWMWSSGKTSTGWVSVQVEFPYPIELTRLGVHSQHSGQYHAAQAVRVSVAEPNGFTPVTTASLKSVDATVTLKPTVGQKWRFEFRAGSSGMVVLRGLEFFSGDDEIFPPLVPLER